MGAKPQPCYNRIRAIHNRVIMRLQCSGKDWLFTFLSKQSRNVQLVDSIFLSDFQLVFGPSGVLQGISQGKGYVDMSTVDVETIVDVHEVRTENFCVM